MRILVISDTHRKDENVEKILKKEGSFDRVFHLGDVEGSQKKLIRMAKCPVDMVAGNNDILGDLPKEKDWNYAVIISFLHTDTIIMCLWTPECWEAMPEQGDLTLFCMVIRTDRRSKNEMVSFW